MTVKVKQGMNDALEADREDSRILGSIVPSPEVNIKA